MSDGGTTRYSDTGRSACIRSAMRQSERAVLAANPLPRMPDGFLMSAQEVSAEVWFRYPK